MLKRIPLRGDASRIRDDECPEDIAARKAVLDRGNRLAFEQECEAAGVDPDKATISPALAANITDYRRKMAAYDEASE